MSTHWHPDLKVDRLEDWLIEIRLVYKPHSIPFTRWPQFNTLRDNLDIQDDPIWVIDMTEEAVDWALGYLRESESLATILSRWGIEPAPGRAAQLEQLKELAELRPDSQSGLERIYEVLTIRRGPFRPWSVLRGMAPYVEMV